MSNIKQFVKLLFFHLLIILTEGFSGYSRSSYISTSFLKKNNFVLTTRSTKTSSSTSKTSFYRTNTNHAKGFKLTSSNPNTQLHESSVVDEERGGSTLLTNQSCGTSVSSTSRKMKIIVKRLLFLTSAALTAQSLRLLITLLSKSSGHLSLYFDKTDPTYVLFSTFAISTFGILLESKTTIGKALSAPLATMAMGLLLANLGFIPFSSPIYNTVNKSLVPLAVPLLLFDSNLKRIWKDTGSLFIAFFLGAISTIVGTIITIVSFFGTSTASASTGSILTTLPQGEGWKIASALMARHIGGAVNFVAVADTLGVSGSSVTAAIAADNVVVALYFGFLFLISKSGMEEDEVEKQIINEEEDEEKSVVVKDPEDLSSSDNNDNISLASIGTSITIASLFVWLGKILTKIYFASSPSASPLPMISILTVCAATAFPNYFSSLRSSATAIGILFMQMFFAVSGSAGSISLVLKKAPSLFVFSFFQISFHFITLYILGKTFNWLVIGKILNHQNKEKKVKTIPMRELYLASNANVGGPTTAAAMAQAKGWNRLILPSLLIGILGYATATWISLSLCPLLIRLLSSPALIANV